MIVAPEGRDGVGSRSGRQGTNYRAGVAIDDAERWIASEAAGGVKIVVAWVVPNLIGALRLRNVGDLLASHSVKNKQRLSAPATYQQVLRGAEG